MQVNNNNLNAMIQMEKKLEQSADALAKLNLNNEQTKHQKQQENISKQIPIVNEQISDVDVAKEIIKQVEIPIAYTANAEVISVQNSTKQTLLDIKA